MTHIEKAEKLLHQKYHCSQALFGAFASDFGLDLKTAFKISTCFGGGMRQGGVCGCITASLMVLGLAFGFYDSQDTEQEIYGNKKTEEFIRRFTEQMEDRAGRRERRLRTVFWAILCSMRSSLRIPYTIENLLRRTCRLP